ncbi:MAG: hypothetical protein AAB921_00610 [Patescibacteria group bacterium]
MSLLILIAATLILFGGFLLLTAFETRSGSRVGETLRRKLDRHAVRLTFIATHIDWSAFVKHMVRTVFERIAHDSAHASLIAVRFVERVLTRTVRSLRERRVGIVATHTESRQKTTLRETLQGFRKTLKKVQIPRHKTKSVGE